MQLSDYYRYQSRRYRFPRQLYFRRKCVAVLFLPATAANSLRQCLHDAGLEVTPTEPPSPEQIARMCEFLGQRAPSESELEKDYAHVIGLRCKYRDVVVDVDIVRENDRRCVIYLPEYPTEDLSHANVEELFARLVGTLVGHGGTWAHTNSREPADITWPIIAVSRSGDIQSFASWAELCVVPARAVHFDWFHQAWFVDAARKSYVIEGARLAQPPIGIRALVRWLFNLPVELELVGLAEGEELSLDEIKVRLADTIRRRDQANWVPRWRTEALVKLVNCCDSFEELVELTTWL